MNIRLAKYELALLYQLKEVAVESGRDLHYQDQGRLEKLQKFMDSVELDENGTTDEKEHVDQLTMKTTGEEIPF